MPSKNSRSSERGRVCCQMGRWRREPVCLLAVLTGTSASEAGTDAEARGESGKAGRESGFPARLSRGDFPEAKSTAAGFKY